MASPPLWNQLPMLSMSSPPSSHLRMTLPVADMSSASHQAQAPIPINMDWLSDPSTPRYTPAWQNLSAEDPYAMPASLGTVDISPLVLAIAFSRNFLAFTGAEALYYENG